MKHYLKVVWGSFALLVVMLIAAPAWAVPVFKATKPNGSEVALKLLDTRCSDPTVLKHLAAKVRPEFLDKFKDARLKWDGKDWSSCWIEFDGVVYSIDEEGSQLQPIPREAFQEDTV